ncbi:hypothetical protein J655_0235 [Acinetobacter sp. 1294243]|nr:hypothetical protein J655_0235 [Acinetobacter sp. 1294243]
MKSNISMMASAHGKLIADKNGCIRLGDEKGPLIIWPYGSKFIKWYLYFFNTF